MADIEVKFKFPPEVDEDWNIQYNIPQGEHRQPPLPLGYERDPEDPYHLINQWTPCKHREKLIRERRCGAMQILQKCKCPTCPIFSKHLSPEDCDFCEFAE